MKVETYLKQGRLLDQRINYHLKKLSELRSAACTISSPALRQDKVQTSRSGDAPFVQALMRVEEMQEQINREIDVLVDLREQINEVIHQVDSDELQMLLIYKYLEGYTSEKIGTLLEVDKSTINRWHRKAIDQITLPENAIVARTRL